jgi:SAM-dependent methyltransferase
MRAWAEESTREPNVRYVAASSYATGLTDASADLVTAAQSLQWMDPERVFPEIARILRAGGVFCAYQYDTLQTPLWRPEAESERVLGRKRELRKKLGLDQDRQRWPISRQRLEDSDVFRFVQELALHSIESGDGERLVGFALSEGSLTTLLQAGVSEEEVGLDRLRAAASEMREAVPWWIGYRVCLGVK